MSIRNVFTKLWTAGRLIIRPKLPVPKLQINRIELSYRARSAYVPSSATVSRLQSTYDYARKLFASSVLRRVTNPFSEELARRTTRQLLFGNSVPFLAYVGISLASGSVLTKEDELEGLCYEIRKAMERMHTCVAEAETDLFREGEEISLKKFTIGPYIGKGCNAAVFAAKLNDQPENERSPKIEESAAPEEFPLALKMMFNYDIQSNAFSILKGMFSETLPTRLRYTGSRELPFWEELSESGVSILPHPNIVTMPCVFADRIPEGLSSSSLFKNALPTRLDPEGFGRNMSLFVVMKRYDMTLSEYLKQRLPEVREAILLFTQLLEAVVHINRSGIAHRDLKCDNILLELDKDETVPCGSNATHNYCPRLVLSDFGSCLADPSVGLKLPLRSAEINRGGNRALMAPEVISTRPGLVSYIDYRKADLWAVGAMAYELFTGVNPFYSSESRRALDSKTYREEELPPLPQSVPDIVQRVVYSILIRSPNKRISPEMAADVLQLYLWAPSSWTRLDSNYMDTLPTNSEILQWLLTLTTKVLTTAPFGIRRSQAEYQLIGSFLRRTSLYKLREALSYIHF